MYLYIINLDLLKSENVFIYNKSRPVEISENFTLSLMSISLTLSLANTQGSVYVRLNRLLLSYYFINTGK